MTGTAPSISGSSPRTLPTAGAFVAAVVSAIVVSVALSAAVAAIAHGAGASHSFKALEFPAYTSLIVIGLLVACAAWSIVRRRSDDPVHLMRRLAPAVVIVSLVPDVLVGAGDSMAGTSWGAVLALMTMHLIVAACGVASFAYFLPLRSAR